MRPVPDWLLERGEPVGKQDHPLKDLIAEVIDSLETRHREALEMWAYEGLTYREIADHFDLAGRQGGHYRVKAALKALKEALEEKGINE